MSKDYLIWRGQNGATLALYEFGLRARLWNAAYNATDALCGATHGKACLICGITDRMWNTPIGPAKRDEDGLLDRSVGTILYDAGQWLAAKHFRDEDVVARIPVTEEQARSIADWADDEDEA